MKALCAPCRTPSYSPMLLTHAWSNQAWVQALEGQLGSFTAGKGGKRHSLPAMPRHQREVVSPPCFQHLPMSSCGMVQMHTQPLLQPLPYVLHSEMYTSMHSVLAGVWGWHASLLAGPSLCWEPLIRASLVFVKAHSLA